MFQFLLESKATPAPRLGGSLVSLTGHAALVASVIALTAAGRDHATEPPDPVARFIAVAPPLPAPVAPPMRAEAAPHSTLAAASVAALSVVLDIPIGLPAIRLGMAVTLPEDFAVSGRRGGHPDGVAAPGGTGTGVPTPYTAQQVDKPVLLLPGSSVPAYPELLRHGGIAGGVMMEFVVDTLGRVESGSMNLIQADHDLFAAAVRRVVPGLRFMPAEAQGRKVRQLVRLPFRFDLH